MNNLADGSPRPAVLAKLHKRLRQHMEETTDPALETFASA